MYRFLDRFQALAQELEQHPKVHLLAFQRYPAAPESLIARFEEVLGIQIPEAMKAFYRETNGLQLRWIFNNNPDFDAEIHIPLAVPMPWSYALQSYRPEDGIIFLLPLEEIMGTGVAMGMDFTKSSEPISFQGKEIDQDLFHASIKPFDVFSFYCNMAFFLQGTEAEPIVLMGDEQCSNYTDSLLTDFESYLEFLLASKGICRKRKSFYGKYQGHLEPVLKTTSNYWDKSNYSVSLDALVFEEEFPLSNQAGSPIAGISTKLMQDAALKSEPILPEAFDEIVEAHNEFLATGGAEGEWQILKVGGIVLGAYRGAAGKSGKQALLDLRKLDASIDLQELQLPYSSWCGAYLKYADFSDADLEGSIFVDAMLEKAIFADANLKRVDFSRASLKGVSFMNSNLEGADFENCDLSDADFRGAYLEGARFPGAKLTNIKR